MKGFEIFGEDEDGGPGDLDAVMQLISHHIEEHDMNPRMGIMILADLINPGHSDTSHDVRPCFVGAMWALGYGEVCENFGSLYLNEMPWGVGFSIGVLPEFEFFALSDDAQRAVIQAIAVVLRSGGLDVTQTDENTLLIKRPKDDDEDDGETSMSVEDIVGQFKAEMEQELERLDDEPDDPTDPTRKWRP